MQLPWAFGIFPKNFRGFLKKVSMMKCQNDSSLFFIVKPGGMAWVIHFGRASSQVDRSSVGPGEPDQILKPTAVCESVESLRQNLDLNSTNIWYILMITPQDNTCVSRIAMFLLCFS